MGKVKPKASQEGVGSFHTQVVASYLGASSDYSIAASANNQHTVTATSDIDATIASSTKPPYYLIDLFLSFSYRLISVNLR